MAYKEYGHKQFRHGNYVFSCFKQGTRYGFRHVCDVVDHSTWTSFRVSCPYYNRTWEAFTYETALRKAADRLPDPAKEEVKAYIRLLAAQEHDRCCRELEKFMEEWGRLPDSMKDALREHFPQVETEEQADTLAAIVSSYNLLTGN
jgi:hypothetical protein